MLRGEVVAKQSIDTTGGSSVESAPMGHKTQFVAIEAVDSDVRYRVRPKALRFVPLAADADDTPVAAGSVVIEAVYPGAVIAFLQTSQVGGTVYPFQQSYVPVLAL